MPSIGNPIPTGWTDHKFFFVANTAGVAVDGNALVDGTAVHGWEFREDNDNQVWLLRCINDKANVWTLYNENTRHYLEVKDGSIADATQVVGNPRKGDNDPYRHNQEWYIYHVEGGGGVARVALQNVMSGTFLNCYANSGNNGVRLVGYRWDASDACIWKIIQSF